MVRLFQFKCHRFTAAEAIQRVYRGHYYRGKWNALIFQKRVQLVDRIKHLWHLYKCRRGRQLMKARQHMARWKIGVSCYTLL
jgi:hypothetical protein